MKEEFAHAGSFFISFFHSEKSRRQEVQECRKPSDPSGGSQSVLSSRSGHPEPSGHPEQQPEHPPQLPFRRPRIMEKTAAQSAAPIMIKTTIVAKFIILPPTAGFRRPHKPQVHKPTRSRTTKSQRAQPIFRQVPA